FDDFRMSFNVPEVGLQNAIAACAGTAVLEVTNPDPDWTGYQWYLDGTPIAGATGSSYATVAGQAGIYSVSAITGDGCASSPSAGLLVSDDCPVPFVCDGSAYLVSSPGSGTPSTLSIVAANDP